MWASEILFYSYLWLLECLDLNTLHRHCVTCRFHCWVLETLLSQVSKCFWQL